jgi:hypothetical protein
MFMEVLFIIAKSVNDPNVLQQDSGEINNGIFIY